MTTSLTPEMIKETTKFHGHWCPGLAIGVRAAEWALREMGRAGDEEIVAVVETDMCGVDAIQYLTGCTFGKGNLIHLDYGKNAFTFYRRRDDKAARLVLRHGLNAEDYKALGRLQAKMQKQGLASEEENEWRETRERIARRLMESSLDEVFEIKDPKGPVPKKARILASLVCDVCGEPSMESRTRRFQEKTLCLHCFEELEKRY
ncbi:MAG: FmdE family protein [Pseudomonadota bacterium]